MPETRPASTLPNRADTRAERQQRLLEELADIGMQMVRQVRDEALAPGAPAESLALTFTRLARAVRQTLALEARLAGEQEARDADSLRERVIRGKMRVRRAVERAIDSDADASDSEVESLLYDLNERLADVDDCAFADRPFGEIIAGICKDLGVPVPQDILDDAEAWDLPPSPHGHGLDPPSVVPISAHAREAGDPGFFR